MVRLLLGIIMVIVVYYQVRLAWAEDKRKCSQTLQGSTHYLAKDSLR